MKQLGEAGIAAVQIFFSMMPNMGEQQTDFQCNFFALRYTAMPGIGQAKGFREKPPAALLFCA